MPPTSKIYDTKIKTSRKTKGSRKSSKIATGKIIFTYIYHFSIKKTAEKIKNPFEIEAKSKVKRTFVGTPKKRREK